MPIQKTPLQHDQLSLITEDQHHPKKHDLSSATEHTGKLNESLIAYPNPPLHSHKGKIIVKKEGELSLKEHSTIEFKGDVTVTESNQYDKAIVEVVTGNNPSSAPIGGDYDGYYYSVGAKSFERWYVAGMGYAAELTTVWAPAPDKIYVAPFFARRTITLDRIGCYVGPAGDAGKHFRVAVWTATSPADPYPNLLVPGTDLGELDAHTGGPAMYSSNIDVTLATGLYWMSWCSNGQPEVRCIMTNRQHGMLGFTSSLLGYPGIGYRSDLVFGAMPATFPNVNTIIYTSDLSMPAIGVRLSA
jgi:hypothetical protein